MKSKPSSKTQNQQHGVGRTAPQITTNKKVKESGILPIRSDDDDVTPAAVAASMTSQTPNEESRDAPEVASKAINLSGALGSSPPDVSTTHQTDDVTSVSGCSAGDADVEVADILEAAPAATAPDELTPEVEGHGEVTREIIMAKTFTESIQPDREFVPIADDDVIQQQLPVDSNIRLTVRCELSQPSTSGPVSAMTSSSRRGDMGAARNQVRDLTSELRHLQSLLDDLSSPSAGSYTDVGDASSDDDFEDSDWTESRVVYRYHVHGTASQASGRRWLQRSEPADDDTTAQSHHY